MSQYWGPPSYPPPRPPQYQPPPLEPNYYYEPDQGSTAQSLLYFLAGSCSTFVLTACCVTALAGAWVTDTYFGISGKVLTNVTETPTAVIETLETDNNLSPDPNNGEVNENSTLTPNIFPIGKPVIANDVAIELTTFDIQRQVQINNADNVSLQENMEFVAVSIQLRSLPPTESVKAFTIRNFQLQKAQNGNLYRPDPQADNGRLLRDGELLPPQNPDNANGPCATQNCVEGDIIFQVPLGENPLFLLWQAPDSTQIHTVALQ